MRRKTNLAFGKYAHAPRPIVFRLIRFAMAGAVLLALMLPLAGLAAGIRSLVDQATEAYLKHDYIRSARIFVAAADQSSDKPDLLYNAACGFALGGNTDQAWSALERAIGAGFEDLPGLVQERDLESLHEDARWRTLLDRIERSVSVRRDFWDSPAMRTPFAENLSDDEKIAGLSKLWAEAKFNFVHFDKVPTLNWDRVYMEHLPKVRATTSTYEYYRVLIAMYSLLRDGHTSVFLPNELANEDSARPLVETMLVEGKVMIVAASGQTAASGLTPGLEIIEVDGLPVMEHARRNVMPFQSASTPQGLDCRVYGQALLAGAEGKPVNLLLRDATGNIVMLSVPRVAGAEYLRTFRRKPMSFSNLPGNVAYVALNSFGDSKTADEFEAVFPQIAKSDALVLDLRENDGGKSDVGYRILAVLTDKKFLAAKWETRDYRPAFRAWGRREARFTAPSSEVPPNGEMHFAKPVVVLTSPRTYSAAEDFVAAFRSIRRGRIIGEATGGSTGQPLFVSLPGGGGARICTRHDVSPDGTEFVGIGIKPDIAVSSTIAHIRSGRDAVLEAALRLLAND